MSRGIAKQVEEELQYPGQIKITVVRETRSWSRSNEFNGRPANCRGRPSGSR